MTSQDKQNDFAAVQCDCATESAKIHQQLVQSKKAQTDLLNTVLSNLEGIPPEEKIEIITELKDELAQEEEAYDEKQEMLKGKIQHAIQELQDQIVHLIGAQAVDQREQIRQLSQDLLNVQEGHYHAVGILFRRYGIASDDIEMQNEVLHFINSIERAENTYQCITQLQNISGSMVSREELIDGILHDAEQAISQKAVIHKSWRFKWQQFRIRNIERLIHWLSKFLPQEHREKPKR